MRIVVVSPPDEYPNERRWVSELCDAGLERYHLRKPEWSETLMTTWLQSLPRRYHGRIVLHAHHALARRFHVLGVHSPASGNAPERPLLQNAVFRSRSCHDVLAVKRVLGRYAAVFFGPVFASLSKPGYGPMPNDALLRMSAVLAERTQARIATEVIAIGGISPGRLAACRDLGFDGVAVIGAVWGAPDPLAAYLSLQAQARVCASSNERSIGS